MPNCDGYEATRIIRKHKDPNIRNILIIAMTASAIQGDRERCLESGMNNYLAKPVRAQTLKALLESYLSKPEEEKEIPDLQVEAKKLVKEALRDVAKDEVEGVLSGPVDGVTEGAGALGASGGPGSKSPEKIPSRPSSIRTNTTQLWRPHSQEDVNGKGGDGHS
jgi:hypothetical protein